MILNQIFCHYHRLTRVIPVSHGKIQRSKCEGVTIVFMPSPKCVCNFQSTFIKAGDCETKEGLRVEAKGLRVEEAKGESLGGTLLWFPRNVIKVSQGRAAISSSKSQKKGAWETGSGC